MNIYGLEMIVAIPMGGYNASATLQMGMLGSINQMSQLLGTCLLQSRSDNLLHPHLQQFGIKTPPQKNGSSSHTHKYIYTTTIRQGMRVV